MITLLNAPTPPPQSHKIQQQKSAVTESTDDECPGETATLRKVSGGDGNQRKYKTEICKNFSEKGKCPYGGKCRFAHGVGELVVGGEESRVDYRTKKCKSFWQNGSCRYGFRCQFQHYEIKKQYHLFLSITQKMLMAVNPADPSKLAALLQPIKK